METVHWKETPSARARKAEVTADDEEPIKRLSPILVKNWRHVEENGATRPLPNYAHEELDQVKLQQEDHCRPVGRHFDLQT